MSRCLLVLSVAACACGPGDRGTVTTIDAASVADASAQPDGGAPSCGLGDGPWRALGEGPIDESVAPGDSAQQVAVAARPGLTVAWTTLHADSSSDARVAEWDGAAWQGLGDVIDTPGFVGNPALFRTIGYTVLSVTDYREDAGGEHYDAYAFGSSGGSFASLGDGPLNTQDIPGEYRPRATLDADGHVLVAFAEWSPGSGPGNPLPWSQRLQISRLGDPPSSELAPAASWDTGSAHVVALLRTTAAPILVGTQGVVDGETRIWRGAVGIDWVESAAGATPGSAEAATFTPSGDVLVLMRDGRVMRWANDAWSLAAPPLGVDFLWADLASDADGRPLVVTVGLASVTWRVAVYHHDGQSWLQLGDVLADQPLIGAAAAIATDACGRPLVAVMTWASGGDGDVHVWFWGDTEPQID